MVRWFYVYACHEMISVHDWDLEVLSSGCNVYDSPATGSSLTECYWIRVWLCYRCLLKKPIGLPFSANNLFMCRNKNDVVIGFFFVHRFADVLGLDLADVHTFLDEIPRVPKSAFNDLKDKDAPALPKPVTSPSVQRKSYNTRADRNLVPLFVQPTSRPDFTDRLTRQKVSNLKRLMSITGLFQEKRFLGRDLNWHWVSRLLGHWKCSFSFWQSPTLL